MEALRELAPDTGSYLNEVRTRRANETKRHPLTLRLIDQGDVNEPDWQYTYYGVNYPRLLGIKRAVDPTDVFWCAVCVGSERWQEEDGRLCQV